MRVLCLCSYVHHSVGMLALVTGLTACAPTLNARPVRVWGTHAILEVVPILACSFWCRHGVSHATIWDEARLQEGYIYSTAQ